MQMLREAGGSTCAALIIRIWTLSPLTSLILKSVIGCGLPSLRTPRTQV